MSEQVHEFELDKSLERILFAMYKARNDLKEEGDRSPEEEIFRQSVAQAVQFGRTRAQASAFSILRNKYKSRLGMGDAAAAVTAGASVLAIPVARAVHRLTPNFIFQKKDANRRREELAAAVNTPRGMATSGRGAGPAEGMSRGVDIDALFGTPRNSIASNNGGNNAGGMGNFPAGSLGRIGELLVREGGAAEALAKMDVDDAIALSEFKGGIDQLAQAMEAQSPVRENLRSPIGQSRNQAQTVPQ